MAEPSYHKVQQVVDKIDLSPGESLQVNQELDGTWLVHLVTDILVHRKHTDKSSFLRKTFYSSMALTAMPSKRTIESFLPSARFATSRLISKGEYSDEELISGQYQTIKRKFNKWAHWDRKNEKIVGKLNDVQ